MAPSTNDLEAEMDHGRWINNTRRHSLNAYLGCLLSQMSIGRVQWWTKLGEYKY